MMSHRTTPHPHPHPHSLLCLMKHDRGASSRHLPTQKLNGPHVPWRKSVSSCRHVICICRGVPHFLRTFRLQSWFVSGKQTSPLSPVWNFLFLHRCMTPTPPSFKENGQTSLAMDRDPPLVSHANLSDSLHGSKENQTMDSKSPRWAASAPLTSRGNIFYFNTSTDTFPLVVDRTQTHGE